MEPIVLVSDDNFLQATFLPDKGMNMISFKKGDIEVIDQSTKPLFEERYAGLGALIGPHFHRRKPEVVPKLQNENAFPHIARVKAKGIQDPFSHGVGRYAPWKAEFSKNKAKAVLTGKDLWNETPLSAIENQNFKMEFQIELKENGLHLRLSVVSEKDSLVGIHYYYSLPQGKGRIISEVQNQFRNQKGELTPIPSNWAFDADHRLVFDLENEADFTFRPYPNPLEGKILLETEAYTIRTNYKCVCEENCWQLYHPKGSSFVCIEPISAQDPRHPNLTVSALDIHLEII